MYRESLSLYRTRGKRCFGLTLSVILLVPICLFSVGPAVGQDGTTTDNPAAQAKLDQARSLRQNTRYAKAGQAFADVISRYPQTDYTLQAYQGLALTQMD